MVQSLGKDKQKFLKRQNLHLPHKPVFPLLGIYPRELKTHVHTKTCARMFLAVVFTTDQNWRQARRLSAGEWINQLGHMRIVKYYSARKQNKLPTRATPWINPAVKVLPKRGQTQTSTSDMVPFTEASGTGRINQRWKKKKIGTEVVWGTERSKELSGETEMYYMGMRMWVPRVDQFVKRVKWRLVRFSACKCHLPPKKNHEKRSSLSGGAEGGRRYRRTKNSRRF